MDLIKITPDKEMVKSIIEMVSLIEDRIKIQDREKMASLIISDYYEIIKELITAVLLFDGYKTLSHKDLIDYVKEKRKDFSEHEISVLDNLRVLRNINKQYVFSSSKETREASNLEKAEPAESSIIDTIALRSKSISSKDKILNFIRKTKKIRTRDLVEQFSVFSKRTVKRTLKELIDDGVIKKEEDERAVYYSILN